MAATKQVSHESPADADDNVYSTSWRGQTFTTTGEFSATSVKLYIARNNTGYGDFTVGIYTTDGSGHPTGAALASKTVDGDVLPFPDAWYEFVFDTPTNLANGEKYAIVCSLVGGSTSNAIEWNYDSANGYAGGNRIYSSNSGSSWTSDGSIDYLFQVWGSPAEEGGGLAIPIVNYYYRQGK